MRITSTSKWSYARRRPGGRHLPLGRTGADPHRAVSPFDPRPPPVALHEPDGQSNPKAGRFGHGGPPRQAPPPRVPSHAQAEVTPVPDGETIEAYAFAIGLDGAGLACCTPLAVGQPVSMIFCFTTRAGAAAREGPLLGRTTSVHFDDDVAIIGVEFAERLSRRTSPCALAGDRAVAPLLKVPLVGSGASDAGT